jgi:hypothetical protein
MNRPPYNGVEPIFVRSELPIIIRGNTFLLLQLRLQLAHRNFGSRNANLFDPRSDPLIARLQILVQGN